MNAESKNTIVSKVEQPKYVVEVAPKIECSSNMKSSTTLQLKANQNLLSSVKVDNIEVSNSNYNVVEDGALKASINVQNNEKLPLTYDDIIRYFVLFGVSLCSLVILFRHKKN